MPDAYHEMYCAMSTLHPCILFTRNMESTYCKTQNDVWSHVYGQKLNQESIPRKKNMTACIIDKNLEVGFYTQVLLYISFIPKKQNVMQNKN